MPLTKHQAHAIAQLVCEIRPNGWAYKQVMTTLEANARNLAPFGVIAQAAVNAAMTPALGSPEQIFQPGAHWPTNSATSGRHQMASCKAHIGHPADTCPVCTAEIKDGYRQPHERGKRTVGAPPPPNFKQMVAAEREKARRSTR